MQGGNRMIGRHIYTSISVICLTFAVLLPAAVAQGQTLYGLAHIGPQGPSTLYTIDVETGEATSIGVVGFNRCSGMDFDAEGTLFAACEIINETPILVTIDLETGFGTQIANFGNVGTLLDISFRNEDGELFGMLFSPTDNTDFLVEIDISNQELVIVGDTMTLEAGNGMAFSPDDTLFHVITDFSPGGSCINGSPSFFNLNTVDQTTGLTSLFRELLPSAPANDCSRINGMDFHPESGVLYGSLNDRLSGGAQENYLATIDIETGVVTTIGQSVDGLGAIAFKPSSENVSSLATEPSAREKTPLYWLSNKFLDLRPLDVLQRSRTTFPMNHP